MNDKQFFTEFGYLVIDNFLPNDVAYSIFNKFIGDGNWEHIDQMRERHYSHIFKTDSLYLPDVNEVYFASFHRNFTLENHFSSSSLYASYFQSTLSQISGIENCLSDIRCYMMAPGDFMRCHIDQYAGKIGSILYLNPTWIWDWGGLLNIITDKSGANISTIFPMFNRIILFDHEKFKYPHFVTPIASYSKFSRFTFLTFSKT